MFEKLQSPPKDGGLWSGLKVGELIQQQFGIRIHRVTAWKQLRRLGFSLQVHRYQMGSIGNLLAAQE
ncbi:winged helix-turn-helix domain-containing protein [Brasilonema sp. CT11]|nr:winged helix-turn-helix domain-containing protein [Brasilonema sp. CT11]